MNILENGDTYIRLREYILTDKEDKKYMWMLCMTFFDYIVLLSDMFNVMVIKLLKYKRILHYYGAAHSMNIARFFVHNYDSKYKIFTNRDRYLDPELSKINKRCLFINN